MAVTRVRMKDLQKYDYVEEFGRIVEGIYFDPGDGYWIDWEDGDGGYIDNPNRYVTVEIDGRENY